MTVSGEDLPVPDLLFEDHVVSAVVERLRSDGYENIKQVTVFQHGEDIVAEKHGRKLSIEAKGEGSSKPHTKRYGHPFTGGQVHDHVAKAILKALRARSAGRRAAIALPDNAHHRREIELAEQALAMCEVGVFWVSTDPTRTVTVDGTF